MNNKIDRLKKLRELALRGIDGEKETAQILFETLSEKYGITEDDLDEDIVSPFILEYHGKEQKKILIQTIFKVTNKSSNCYYLCNIDTGRTAKTKLRVYCTEAQKVEIEFLFDFYVRVWEEEVKTFLTAFIFKHDIFGDPNADVPVKELTPEESLKIHSFQMGMSSVDPVRQLKE